MDTIFMNSENSQSPDPRRRMLNLSDKKDLKRSDKYVSLSNLSIYYTWKNIKKSYENNKFKISELTWSGEFELPDGSYFVSDIQGYFECIMKKHDAFTDNPAITRYVIKIENRIKFRIKKGYYLQVLAPETRKLLDSTKRKVTKDENDENVPHLEITEVVLVHCNIAKNDYLFLINGLVNY